MNAGNQTCQGRGGAFAINICIIGHHLRYKTLIDFSTNGFKAMTVSIDEAQAAIYQSLANDNKDLDAHIAQLRAALQAAGQKEAVLDPAQLYQDNREGRKLLQSYFKRKGVRVSFKG